MPREAATGYETGGGGTNFEREVAASYLLAMMARSPVLNEPGSTLATVSFQVRGGGWLFDDLLLELEDCNQARIAVSVKSGGLMSGSNWTETRSDAYEMLKAGDPFRIGQDKLLVETSSIPEVTHAKLATLLSLASGIAPENLHERIIRADPTIAPEVRDYYSRSCSPPAALTNAQDYPVPAVLLKHLIIRRSDLRELQSDRRNELLRRCEDILDGPDSSAPRKLWDALIGIASELAPINGVITRAQLTDRLAPHHQLRAAPDVRGAFDRLREWSAERIREVRITLGRTYSAPRALLTQRIAATIRTNLITIISGQSGTGKTVAAVRACVDCNFDITLFVGSSDIRTQQWNMLLSALPHSLDRVLRLMPYRSCAVIIDGCELLDDQDHLDALGRLVTTLERVASDRDVHIVMTAQEYATVRLMEFLSRPNRLLASELVHDFTNEDMAGIQNAIPELRRADGARRLSDVFRNPKILDVVASHLVDLDGLDMASATTSEVDVFQWYWDRVIGRLSVSGKDALLRLATHQADQGNRQSRIAELPNEVAQAASSFQVLGICTVDTYNVIKISHDIIADWSQLGVLLSLGESAASFMDARLMKLRWRPAVRLWIQKLVETDANHEAWVSWWNRNDLWHVLAIEALVPAKNAPGIMAAIWPHLVSDHGAPLRKFLTQFSQYATIPDPKYDQVTSTMGIEGIRLREALRIPLEALWQPIVEILIAHVPEVLVLAADRIANLCSIWLRSLATDHPLSDRIRRLALAVGRHAWSGHATRMWRGEFERKDCYSALLAAYLGDREGAANVLRLVACRRLPSEGDPKVPLSYYTAPRETTQIYSGLGSHDAVMPAPWPDGPLYRSDEEFRRLIFANQGIALFHVLVADPDLAAEILLASIIEEPTAANQYESRSAGSRIEHAGLESQYGFLDDHPSYSIWSTFFGLQPEKALKAVIRLVDFSTTRALEAHAVDRYIAPARSPLILLLDGERVEFPGTQRFVNWHLGQWAHPQVVMALMALERHCYESIDKGADLGSVFTALLVQGRSAAFLGVLWEVARYKVDLIDGPLRPLISCLDLYEWELHANITGAHRIVHFSVSPSRVQKHSEKWVGMSHRTVDLRDLITQRCALGSIEQGYCESIRRLWSEIRSALPEGHPEIISIDISIAKMTEENYRRSHRGDDEILEFIPPRELALRMRRQGESANNNIRIHHLIAYCQRAIAGSGPIASPEELTAEIRRVEAMRVASTDDEADDVETGDDEVREKLHDAATIGLATLLLLHHAAWCDSHVEEDRVVRVLTRLAVRRSVPNRSALSRYDRSPMHVESFSAYLSVALLLRDVTRNIGLRLMLSLAISSREASAGTVVGAMWHWRHLIGEVLWRFVVVLIARCRLTFTARALEHASRVFEPDLEQLARARQDHEASVAQFDACCNDFLTESLDVSSATTWAESALSEATRRSIGPPERFRVPGGRQNGVSDEPDRYRTELNLSSEVVIEACVPHVRPSVVTESAERARWGQFLGQALMAVMAELELVDQVGQPLSLKAHDDLHVPYEHQLTVINVCAVESLTIDDDATAMSWWRMILKCNARIEYSLEHWFSCMVPNLESVAATSMAARRWSRMIDELAFADGTRFPIRSRDVTKIWRSALGFFDDPAASCWSEISLAIVQAKVDIVRTFLLDCIRDGHEAPWAMRLGRSDANRPFRKLVCECCLESCADWTTLWWRDDNAEELAQLLLVLFAEDLAGTTNQSYRERYLPLIAALSAQQHPLTATLLERASTS